MQKAILIIDDDPSNLRFLQEVLKDIYKVHAAPSGQRAVAFLEKRLPDLIITDLEMPGMDGYEVIRSIKARPEWAEIPIIVITGHEGKDKEIESISLGAVDFIKKPLSFGVVRARIKLHLEIKEYKQEIENLVKEKTRLLEKSQEAIMNILFGVTSLRASETPGHIKRVTSYVEKIMACIRSSNSSRYIMDEAYRESVILSAPFHDIGNVSVAENLLLKPLRLIPLEYELIKQHTLYGAQIFDSAIKEGNETADFLKVAREIALYHHEKWDGSGYPHKIAKEEIPLSARIVAIADVYDALVTVRPYRSMLTHKEAVAVILDDAGKHFDPYLVDISRSAFDDFENIARQVL